MNEGEASVALMRVIKCKALKANSGCDEWEAVPNMHYKERRRGECEWLRKKD